MKPTLMKGARMAMMSVVSFVVNLGIFALVSRYTPWPPEVAAVIAIAIVMVMNFGACRYWIFDARSGDMGRQMLGFGMATIGFRSAELGAFSLIYRLTNWNEVVLYGAVLVVSFVAKLLFFEKRVFTASR